MRPFDLVRAGSVAEAVSALAARPGARLLAGGTNLVDHLRLGIAAPDLLIDVSRLPLGAIEPTAAGGLRIGANVRNADLAADARVRRDFPLLARALLAGASGQIRNVATTAGNLLQRTRCVYFQDLTTPCAKRTPGDACSAKGGFETYNAILGLTGDDACVAVHPSDLCVPLAALDTRVLAVGPGGERAIDFLDVHRLPGDAPERDTTLAHDEVIVAIEMSPLPPGARSTYRKARERASYAFALASVAAALEVGADGRIAFVRLAFGSVAHRPWRAHAAEAALLGQPASRAAFRAAAQAELSGARTTHETAFKTTLVANMVEAVLADLAGLDGPVGHHAHAGPDAARAGRTPGEGA